MRTKRNRSSLIVVLSLLLLMAMLTACSSATVEETKVSETTVEVKEEVTEVEVAEAEPTAEPTPEPTAEPTPEPTPEAVVYEGIDMQSELPVKEWVTTLLGVVDEPKFIIANDETNKKVILEEGDKAIVEDGDMVIFYDPNGLNAGNGYEGQIGRIMVDKLIKINEYCKQLTFVEGSFTKESSFKVTIPTDEGEKVVSCVLIPG